MLSWLGGLLVFILDVYAITQIIGSGASNGAKALWIVLILVLPLVGFLIWLVAGPKSGHVTA